MHDKRQDIYGVHSTVATKASSMLCVDAPPAHRHMGQSDTVRPGARRYHGAQVAAIRIEALLEAKGEGRVGELGVEDLAPKAALQRVGARAGGILAH